MNDDDGSGPWWEHAVNALGHALDAHSQAKQTAEAQREAEFAFRKRQRAKGERSRGGSGSFGEAASSRRRVKITPDEPCCDGPRRK